MKRRTVLGALSLLPLLACSTPPPEPIKVVKPPAHPVGEDFETPAELEQYIADLDAYLTAQAARVAEQDVHDLAAEISRRTTELIALVLTVSAAPDKAREVAEALHVNRDTRFVWASISTDMQRPEFAWTVHEGDREAVRSYLWGRDFIEVTPRLTGYSNYTFEMDAFLQTALGVQI